MSSSMKGRGRTLVRLARLVVRQWRRGDYYHLPQPKGAYMAKDAIKGYYNDLRLKAYWKGERDEEGIPISVTSQGRKPYFPVTITQFALGHYDLWLETGDQRHLEEFLKAADWLLSSQDEQGGWDVFGQLSMDVISPYSAMAQGQAISVLLRAFLETKNEKYLTSTERALELMLLPVQKGGTARYVGKDLFLEEVVTRDPNTILNGWIFAIFGLWDYALFSRKGEAHEMLADTLATLERHLERYDRGWWSNYDWRGAIASPFYHRLHIALFQALVELTGREVFGAVAKRWEGYARSPVRKVRAIGLKVWQKLNSDSEVVSG